MEKKYMLTDEVRIAGVKTLYRIVALKNFSNVKAGDLGGFIEKEENLSQEGNAWVYDYAQIYDNARVCGNAWVSESAEVYGNALVCERAWVSEQAKIYGNARISGDAQIYDNARIYGNAQIYDNARIYDNTLICDNAVISQNQYVSYGVVKTDLSKPQNLIDSIKAQCNLLAIGNKVIAYKLVRPNLTSFYDKDFQYEVGKKVKIRNYDESNKPCASGLHFSNPTYWEKKLINKEYVYLEAEINLNDIITVQRGKIRCRKAKILRAFKLD